MARRAVSLALAASVLAGSLFLYTRSLSIWGPILYFPFVGAPAVVGMMVLRAALVRKLGGGPDATARALELIALGAMLAPGAGVVIAMTCLHDMEGGHCGLSDASAAAAVLGLCWPLWGAGELVVLAALVHRRSALARLRAYQAVATILTIILAPPLAVLACVATCFENEHGGAGVTFLLPAAIAAGSTVVAWTRGRSFAANAALRRVVAAALTLGVALFLVLLSRTPLPGTCVSFWTTTTWGLLAEVGWAVPPCLAVILYYSRDPVYPTE
jgi:hypothetical protein